MTRASESTDRFMIDIETLGTSPGSIIWAIAAVKFDLEDEIIDTHYRSVDPSSSKSIGLDSDIDTVKWLLDQSDDVQKEFADGMNITHALSSLNDFFADNTTPTNDTEVWANSPAFDIVLLEAAYEQIDLEPPWKYYQTRDVRTLAAVPVEFPDLDEVKADYPDHHALGDAIRQAKRVARGLDYIESTSE